VKSFLKKISSTKFGFFLKSLVGRFEYTLMQYYHDKEKVTLLKDIANEDSPFLLNPSELYTIYAFAEFQNRIEGDYAEVGVFKGATAKAICEQKSPDKTLYLFDTFEGLPEVDKIDEEMFAEEQFVASEQLVRDKLSNYTNIEIHKGFFPQDSSDSIADKTFAFVHLDVDIYRSTLDSLRFFYPRLNSGGVLISHDYHAAGVKKAFDEFCSETQETVIQFSTSQCMIQKL